mmetsp:Transcript_18358/g.50607  ORF Transcript_18358/g.50607 Transcript_18358/m.50607 type:complete len:617 (-) Transcript_18358:29-1879(-)
MHKRILHVLSRCTASGVARLLPKVGAAGQQATTQARRVGALTVAAGLGWTTMSTVFAEKDASIEIDAFAADELEDGEMKAVPTGQGKTKVLIARVDGKYYAVSNSCTHVGAPMDTGILVGTRVLCPWHNAAFSVVTGAALDMPGRDSLDVYPVEVRGGRVIVKIPPNTEQRQYMEPRMAKPDPKADPRCFLIVGAGAAAQVAAETLRIDGYQGRIVMVTGDANAPYDRTRLTKILGIPLDKISLRPHGWYEEHGVELLTGKNVKLLDAETKVAILSDGGQIAFDKVLVASGATPRKLKVPGADLKHIFTMRSAADSAAVRVAAGDSKTAVIIGSSFIGIEAASALKDSLKLDRVVVVGMEAVPMERVLGKEVGAVIQKMGEDKGVEFMMRRTVKRFEAGPHGVVKEVVLDNGTVLPADMVVVGAGVVPNADFVAGVPKAQDGSIKVDAFMRAGAEGVYAAGDVANFPYSQTGERARIEHWNVAMQQGRTAARNLAGKRTSTYTTVPYFWSAFFGGKLNYVGYNGGHDEVLIEGDLAAKKFIAYYGRDGAVVAAASMGVPNSNLVLAEALRLGRLPPVSQLRSGKANIDTIRESLKEAGGGCGRAACCSRPAQAPSA